MKRGMPKLGKILYDKAIGNRAPRRGEEPKITEVEVVKVGRSLFTCRPVGETSRWADTVFRVDPSRGWWEKSEYSPQHMLYESRQEILDEDEAQRIHDEIKNGAFGTYRATFSLVSLRAIRDIIAKEKESK